MKEANGEKNPRRLRMTIGGMMLLVAIIAIVLSVLDRRERSRRAQIARAYALMEASPHLGINRGNSRASLGGASADGRFFQVEFVRPDGFKASASLPIVDPNGTPIKPSISPPPPGTAQPSPAGRPGMTPTETP